MSNPFFHERCEQVAAEANRLYLEGADWLTLFRAVLGIDGLARKSFPNADEFARFDNSAAKLAVDLLISTRKQESLKTTLVSKRRNDKQEKPPTSMITVRMQASLHDQLRVEANAACISLNKLCIDKLRQPVAKRTPLDKLVHPVHSRFANSSGRVK